MDWFKIGKGVRQGCTLAPSLFNLFVEYIMWNVRLEEAQVAIKIAGIISTTSCMQMAPRLWKKAIKELKSLLMNVKEENEKNLA